MRHNAAAVVKSLILLSYFTAPGVLANDFRTARSAALGGAGHANPVLTDSVYQNPSCASFLNNYGWSGGFKALGEGRGRAYSLSILDGRAELFQAGIAYTVRDELRSVHIGASRAVGPALAAGVGAKLFYSRDKSKLENHQNFNLSATAVPRNWLQLSLTADNLLHSGPASKLGLEREVILGTAVKIPDKVMLYVDPRARLGDGLEISKNAAWGYEVGSEMEVFKKFYFRLGRFKNVSHPDVKTKADGFAYGVGWAAPKISFDFAVERMRFPEDRLSQTSSLTIYF